MLCPHCMSVNDVAASMCSKCGSPFSRESPGLAPLAGASEDAVGDLALAARSAAATAANEPMHGEEGPRVSAEAHPHQFNRVHVVFREDGSALLEYSEVPPGEAVVDEPTPPAAIPGPLSPAHVGPTESVTQLALPGLTNEPPVATAAPPSSGQWAAGPASMTAFVVGAAMATVVLVSGYLVYRSLAPGNSPAVAAPPPSTAIFDAPSDARQSVRPDTGRAPPAVGLTPIAPPVATTEAKLQPAAPTTGSRPPAASPPARAPVAAPANRGAEAPPPPPLNVPCNAAVAALGLCTPTEPGRP